MAGLNLAAIGAGLGLWAKNMQEQRAQQERQQMLQMQIQRYQQEQKLRQDQEQAAAGAWNLGDVGGIKPAGTTGGDLSGLAGIPGAAAPVIAQPQVSTSGGDPLSLISKFESGGRNIKNPTSSASGPWQFLDSTWRETAPKEGVDISQYPTAMSAPVDVQKRVAQRLYNERGYSPWAPYNSRLAAALRGPGVGGAGRAGAGAMAPEFTPPPADDAALDTGGQPAGNDAGYTPFSRTDAGSDAANEALGYPARGGGGQSFDTPLSPADEQRFQAWKARYAPNDSGADYDLRGAFKAGLTPDPQTGHWPDTFKKPNHPTFSNQSQYATGANAARAGSWQGETYIPPGTRGTQVAQAGGQTATDAGPQDDLGAQIAKIPLPSAGNWNLDPVRQRIQQVMPNASATAKQKVLEDYVKARGPEMTRRFELDMEQYKLKVGVIEKEWAERNRRQDKAADRAASSSGQIFEGAPGTPLRTVDPNHPERGTRPIEGSEGLHRPGLGAAGKGSKNVEVTDDAGNVVFSGSARQSPEGWIADKDGKLIDIPETGNIRLTGTGAGGASNPKSVDFVAKGIADYTLAPLGGWALRSKFGQDVMAKVKELNPEYDQTKYGAKARGLVAFTTGRQSDSVRSFSVAIDHLAVMEDAANALENGDVQMLNAARNRIRQEFGYEGPVDFNFTKSIVGAEVSKAVVGGVGSTTDRDQLRDSFNTANSPEQLAGVARFAKRLMAGQLGGYRRQAAIAGFSEKDFDAALSPRAKQELEGLNAPGGQAPQGGARPQQEEVIHNPQTGEEMVKRNGQWVPR